jgi:hypothetical protein
MVDPISNLDEDVAEADAPRCETCSEPIVNAPEHRVVTWISEGTVSTAHFCDVDCRNEWER